MSQRLILSFLLQLLQFIPWSFYQYLQQKFKFFPLHLRFFQLFLHFQWVMTRIKKSWIQALEFFHHFTILQKSFHYFHFALRIRLILRLIIKWLITKVVHPNHFLFDLLDFLNQIQLEFILDKSLRNYFLSHYKLIIPQDLSFYFLLNQNQIENPLLPSVNAHQIIQISNFNLPHLDLQH